jgi:hypothetical protein
VMGHDPEGQGRRGTRVGPISPFQGLHRLLVAAGAAEPCAEAENWT